MPQEYYARPVFGPPVVSLIHRLNGRVAVGGQYECRPADGANPDGRVGDVFDLEYQDQGDASTADRFADDFEHQVEAGNGLATVPTVACCDKQGCYKGDSDAEEFCDQAESPRVDGVGPRGRKVARPCLPVLRSGEEGGDEHTEDEYPQQHPGRRITGDGVQQN